MDLGGVACFVGHRDLSSVSRHVHASTGRIPQETDGHVGSRDAGGLPALKAARMEVLIDRIAHRVEAKPAGLGRAGCLGHG